MIVLIINEMHGTTGNLYPKINGRLIHEKASKNGGENEFTTIIADRFIVSARSHGVDLATLKAAVNSLDLSKLEAMKDLGVQKP